MISIVYFLFIQSTISYKETNISLHEKEPCNKFPSTFPITLYKKTYVPIISPPEKPTLNPTNVLKSTKPTIKKFEISSVVPSIVPTKTPEPTEMSTEEPTEIPTEEPTEIPTEEPTETPTETLSLIPTLETSVSSSTDNPTYITIGHRKTYYPTILPTPELTQVESTSTPTKYLRTNEPSYQIVNTEKPSRNYLRHNKTQITNNYYTTNYDENTNPLATILYVILAFVICICIILSIMTIIQIIQKTNR